MLRNSLPEEVVYKACVAKFMCHVFILVQPLSHINIHLPIDFAMLLLLLLLLLTCKISACPDGVY
jgi:hypothetical protein